MSLSIFPNCNNRDLIFSMHCNVMTDLPIVITRCFICANQHCVYAGLILAHVYLGRAYQVNTSLVGL